MSLVVSVVEAGLQTRLVVRLLETVHVTEPSTAPEGVLLRWDVSLFFFEPRQFAVIAFCVMPDHAHLLLEALADDSDFKETMRRWKSATGYAWKQRTREKLWQEGYYDRVLREHDSDLEVVRYILDNPIRAGLTRDDKPYPYMGSSRFTTDQLREAAGDWSPYDGSRRRV